MATGSAVARQRTLAMCFCTATGWATYTGPLLDNESLLPHVISSARRANIYCLCVCLCVCVGVNHVMKRSKRIDRPSPSIFSIYDVGGCCCCHSHSILQASLQMSNVCVRLCVRVEVSGKRWYVWCRQFVSHQKEKVKRIGIQPLGQEESQKDDKNKLSSWMLYYSYGSKWQ